MGATREKFLVEYLASETQFGSLRVGVDGSTGEVIMVFCF